MTAAKKEQSQGKESPQEGKGKADTNLSSRWPPLGNLGNATIDAQEYRGKQFQSEEYKRWIRNAVQPITYDTERAALAHGGDRTAMQQPEVFLMTHGSPGKLPAMRRLLKLWNGPAAVAVLIPVPRQHPAAATCRQRVLEYMRDTVAQLPPPWSDVSGSVDVGMTLLYANSQASNMDITCNLTATSSGLDSPELDRALWDSQFKGKPYLDIYDAQYPAAELHRAALDLVPEDAFVFHADPDFAPPPNAAGRLAQAEMAALLAHAAASWRSRRERHAVIVPALQIGAAAPPQIRRQCAPSLARLAPTSQCWLLDGAIVPCHMSTLRLMEFQRQVIGYQQWRWPQSQGCYDPARAIYATAPYSIRYGHPCSPFTIALKAALPPVDRRWRDAAHLRSSSAAHMASWGFSFHVGVGIFMVQAPGGSPPPLKETPPEGTVDAVFNDLWALPHALTRVQLEDMRAEEEHVCDVIPEVPPLPYNTVVEVLQRDGLSGRTCGEEFAPLEWWAVPGSQRPAVMPVCADALCIGPQLQSNAALPQVHVALWALGGAAVAWGVFAWMWGTVARPGAARHESAPCNGDAAA